jgi:aspartate-semialdehyde dehydrogenase
VFHGYSYSLWVEFEPFISKENLSMALFAEEDPPTNAGVAGENGISVGGIRQDPNQSRAYWFWMVIDNLRVAAENAVQVLEQSCRV